MTIIDDVSVARITGAPRTPGELPAQTNNHAGYETCLATAERIAYIYGYLDAITQSKAPNPVRYPPRSDPNQPSHAELDRRRYPPGGRQSWLLPDALSPNVSRETAPSRCPGCGCCHPLVGGGCAA